MAARSSRTFDVPVQRHRGSRMRAKRRWLGAVVLAAVMALGCSESGPKRHRVWGTVTYDGQPIPFGSVVFTPDGAQKNSGPQGIAEIHDGKYDTGATGGKGIGGGPTIIQVTGLSGPGGKPLCDHEQKADLP